jgi:excisionase family DNA binding protein
MAINQKFLTVPEVAEAARAPVATIYSWIDSGKLPSSKPGRRRLVREDVLVAFLNGAPMPADIEAPVSRKRGAR